MTGLARAWDRAWFGPVAASRPWLAARVTLALLALDAWGLMIERGGRYGAGHFNVAHFAPLDALPLPTPGLYVGLVLSCGALAALAALGVATRALTGALTLAWTWAWAMSQLDSYQHHYFLSWVLLALALLPSQRLVDLKGCPSLASRPGPVSAWGLKLLSATCAVLYAFTALSKLEPAWTSGEVLRRLQGTSQRFDPFLDLAASLGLSADAFWPLAGASVAVAQLVIASAYLSFLVTGDGPGRGAAAWRTVGWLTALSFHAGAEHFGLRIGWFSYYMMLLATALLLPARVTDTLVAGPAAAARWFVPRVTCATRGARLAGVGLVVLAAATLAVAFDVLELPGARAAGAAAAGLVLGLAVVFSRPAPEPRRSARWLHLAAATAVTAWVLTVTMEVSPVRYDFYRYIGGDATRRGEYQLALDAYGKANTFAPPGESRWQKVVDVRQRLRHLEQ